MKSVGEILRKARIEKKLTLEEVEKEIKIRAQFLRAIEEDEYQKFPSSVYIKGFIKNYSEFLGLSSSKVLAIFRRQFDEKKNLGILPKGLVPAQRPGFFRFRASQLIIFSFFFLLSLFFGYLYREYRSFTQPPPLTIQNLKESNQVRQDTIDLKGKTDPDARLFLNGQKIMLEPDGSFTQAFNLVPGPNDLEFVAKNKLGKEKKVKINIEFIP
ncbi:helix-turn-helix domain-containing protein [Candidatus Microgenomates bacterium]|nr:helix-turn-helix domain-containing protein [Candidatus Microgenomates bacterium]